MIRRRQLVSIAEPLSDSDDEFTAESRAEAKAYAEVQRVQTERDRIREENKLRKQRGEPPLPLPKISGQRRKGGGTNARGHSPGSTNAGDGGAVDVEHGGGATAVPRGEDLDYEGQVILPFNPLYFLARLPDPDDKAQHIEVAKQKVVDRLAGRRPTSSPTGTASPRQDWTPTKVSIFKVPAPVGSPSPVSSKDQAPYESRRAIEGDDEEAPEGDYDEENTDVVVPWGEAVNEEEANEGVYSDDENLFKPSPTSSPTTARSDQQIQTTANDDLPSYRPTFPFSDEQRMIGPYSVDDDDKEIAIPTPINRFLKPYQRIGAKFLYDHYRQGMGAVLGDDMGLGKTIQVISFLSAIMRKSGTSADYQRRKILIRSSPEPIHPRYWPTVLIVCPKSLVANWTRELDTWGYFEYAIWRSDNAADIRTSFLQGFLDIVLVSYDTARTSIALLKDLPLSAVVADEAHRMKEPTALATLALKAIECKVCFGLTGTLVQNRMDEMWSILDFVHRGWAGTQKQWKEFAVNPIKKGHRHEGTVAEVITAIMRLGIMTHKILPHFYLRRDKRLIAHELPEKRDMVIFCPLAPRQIQAYRKLIGSDDVQFILRRNDPCECGSGSRRLECCHQRSPNGDLVRDLIFKNMSACTKVANHFGLLYHAKDDPPHMREVNSHFFEICTGFPYNTKSQNAVQAALDPANCGKWTLLEQLLVGWRNERVNNKILIFSNSVRLLKMIAEFISTSSTLAGFAVDMLTGEAGNNERMAMVDRFQDQSQDYFVFLISTLAGGVGLNLTAANKVVIFDPDWNPANDLQAMDRAFRIGQKRTVDVYRLIGQGTIEELMYERQIHKQTRARQLNDGTFERRIHQGFDGARTAEDQGELFGIQNIFRFDPEGYVSRNLERIRQAEDRFVQDLIEAEYKDSEAEDGESDEEGGRAMREERKARDLHRARMKAASRKGNEVDMTARKRHEDVVNDLLGQSQSQGGRKDDSDVLHKLGVSSRIHEQAFVDSPEERAIYDIGVQILKTNPTLARTIKANDLGKLSRSVKRRAKVIDADDEHDVEPWQKRIKEKASIKAAGTQEHKRVLAELSD